MMEPDPLDCDALNIDHMQQDLWAGHDRGQQGRGGRVRGDPGDPGLPATLGAHELPRGVQHGAVVEDQVAEGPGLDPGAHSSVGQWLLKQQLPLPIFFCYT